MRQLCYWDDLGLHNSCTGGLTRSTREEKVHEMFDVQERPVRAGARAPALKDDLPS